MAHLIDKDALVAELQRLSNEWRLLSSAEAKYRREVYTELLSFLDILEAKEIDLEEKATQLSQKYFPDEENIWARANIEAQRCKSACIEMVEWLKAQKGE